MKMSNETLFNEIISKILIIDLEKINDSISRDNFKDWDSMTHVVLISELEQEFKITFSDEDIISIKTVGDIKSILQKKGINL